MYLSIEQFLHFLLNRKWLNITVHIQQHSSTKLTKCNSIFDESLRGMCIIDDHIGERSRCFKKRHQQGKWVRCKNIGRPSFASISLPINGLSINYVREKQGGGLSKLDEKQSTKQDCFKL